MGVPAESDSPGEATGNDEIGFWIWFESVADGWYSSWKNSSGPLSDVYAPDDYVCEEGEALYGPAKPYDYPALDDTSEYTDEKVSYEIDGISATTPNGGYMAIDGETTQYILISAFLGGERPINFDSSHNLGELAVGGPWGSHSLASR